MLTIIMFTIDNTTIQGALCSLNQYGEYMYKKALLFLMIYIMFITGCSNKEAALGTTGKKQLVLALVVDSEETIVNSEIENQIAIFNDNHDDFEIVTKKYVRSEDSLTDGVHRLQREIVSGEGPDIIDFDFNYRKSDVVGEYTENLYDYIENDEILKNDLFMNVVDSFAVDGKLYAIPTSVFLHTFISNNDELIGYDDLNINTLLDVFVQAGNKHPMRSSDKLGVLSDLLFNTLDDYIDWDKGINYFNSKEFRRLLEYSDTFNYEYDENNVFAYSECIAFDTTIGNVYDTACAEGTLGTEDIAYIGFPNRSGSEVISEAWGSTLAISIDSDYKVESWEFIKQFFSDEYQENNGREMALSYRKSIIEKQIKDAKEIEYSGDEKVVKGTYTVDNSSEQYPIYSITDKQATDMWNLMERVNSSSLVDEYVYTIVLEEADKYFADQQSVDDAINGIENRIGTYISEKG